MTQGNNPNADLKNIIIDVVKLDREKESISQDRKSIIEEAKIKGFDTKIINKVANIIRKGEDPKKERDIVDMYLKVYKEC